MAVLVLLYLGDYTSGLHFLGLILVVVLFVGESFCMDALAQAGAGTLAYYEPWGDVVFFYGDYNENPSLFELGQALSGGELVRGMSGTITIEAVE